MRLSTRTWLPVTAPVSVPSTYVTLLEAFDNDHILIVISLQILKVVEIENNDSIRRPYIKQLLQKDLKFPLPHRAGAKVGKKVFAYSRPSTFA